MKYYYDYPVQNVREDDPQYLWFYSALRHQLPIAEKGWGPLGTYFEFGVGGGGLMFRYIKALKRFCNEFKIKNSDFNIFGFDTFEGFPESNILEDQHPMWIKGEPDYSKSEVMENLKSLTDGTEFNNFRFIKGKFQDTLTDSLKKELSNYSPSIVSIDVDYYSSTKFVLEWLRSFMHSGTLLYFDDIWSFHGNPNYGQIKAINEFNSKNNGHFTPFPYLGLPSYCYIYSRKYFEYNEMKFKWPK